MGFASSFQKFKHQMISSFSFYYEAKTLYNIHSPFLFKFLSRITQYSEIDKKNFAQISSLVKRIKKDKRKFQHLDYGQGSRRNKPSKMKKISAIVKTSSSTSSKGKKLYKVAQFLSPNRILELGTNLGIGSAYLAFGNPNGQLTTLEGDEFLANISNGNLESLNIQNANIIIDQFDNYLLKRAQLEDFDFIFIDGNHSYDATIRYFNVLYNAQVENQVIIIDDIYWSRGMTKAWSEIQSILVSGYSIDMFDIGIIINSKAIEKVIALKYINKSWKPLSFGFWG